MVSRSWNDGGLETNQFLKFHVMEMSSPYGYDDSRAQVHIWRVAEVKGSQFQDLLLPTTFTSWGGVPFSSLRGWEESFRLN